MPWDKESNQGCIDSDKNRDQFIRTEECTPEDGSGPEGWP